MSSSSSSSSHSILYLQTQPQEYCWVDPGGREHYEETDTPPDNWKQACMDDNLEETLQKAQAVHKKITFDPIPNDDLQALMQNLSESESVTLWCGCTFEQASNMALHGTTSG